MRSLRRPLPAAWRVAAWAAWAEWVVWAAWVAWVSEQLSLCSNIHPARATCVCHPFAVCDLVLTRGCKYARAGKAERRYREVCGRNLLSILVPPCLFSCPFHFLFA